MHYENLIFEGGGMKAVAYSKVPIVLERYGILKNIKKVAGSSAGSIAALLIALKYDPEEIKEIFENLSFNQFKDTYTHTYKIFRMIFTFGINSGEYFSNWIQCRIRFKTGNRYTTFKELYYLTGIELVITGTNMNTGETSYFSYKTTPDMQLWKAVRISITIPVFFTPILYKDDMYMDGGILSNYPIWIFDDEYTYEQPKEISKINNKTLGFKLITYSRTSEINNNPYKIPILSIIIKTIMLLLNYADKSYDSKRYKSRTVEIDVSGINSIEFDLNRPFIDMLAEKGSKATEDFLNKVQSKEDFILSYQEDEEGEHIYTKYFEPFRTSSDETEEEIIILQ